MAILAAVPPVAAQDSQGALSQPAPYSLSGKASYSALASWADDGAFDAGDLGYGADAALELALQARRPVIRAYVSGRADVLTGIAAAAGAGSGRFVALDADGSASLALSVDRAYLRWSPGPLVATAGRQVVNWGSGLLWSPADLFADTVLPGLSPERSGTDAVRVALPLGALSGLEAVAAPRAALADGRYGGRVYGSALGADFGLQAARDGSAGETVVAINVKTDIVLGVWAEAAYTLRDEGGGDDGLETVVGADWSLGSRFLVAAEYRYDSGGAADAAQATAAASRGEAFPAAHYLYASASSKAGDFASVAAVLVADLGNGLVALTAQLALDIAQDATLAIWARYANGSFATFAAAAAAAAGLSLSLAF